MVGDPGAARLDPELAAVVSAWPGLPPVARAGVLALVRACGEGSGSVLGVVPSTARLVGEPPPLASRGGVE